MFLWTAKGKVWSSDSLVDLEATAITSDEESSRARKPGDFVPPPAKSLRHSGSGFSALGAQLNPKATEASNRIIFFVLVNIGLQLFVYLLAGGRLMDVAQKIQLRPASTFAYLVDVFCLVMAGNGFLIWLHLLVLALLRERTTPNGKNGLHHHNGIATGSNKEGNNTTAGWAQLRSFIKTKGTDLLSSIRFHCFFAIFFEAAWTLFILIDGWAFMRFGLHIFSTTVLHMLMNPMWFLGMAHVDLFKAVQALGGVAIFLSIQAGIFYACGLLWLRCPSWLLTLCPFVRRVACSKRLLAAIPVCYIVITSLYLATPLPYGDVASTALPINYVAMLSAFRSGHHESYNLPKINVNKLGIVDKELTTLHPSLYPQLRHRKNVLLILGDSLRTDWYSTEHSAETREFLAQSHVNYTCSSYPLHFTNGHTTEGGMFSMMYSLWPELNIVKRMELIGPAASFPLSVLKANGYSLYGYKTGVLGYSYILRHESPAFFGVNQFNHHHDHPDLNDEQVVDKALQWRKNRLLYKKVKESGEEDNAEWAALSADKRKQVEEDGEGEYYFTVVFLSRAHALALSTRDPQVYWAAAKTYDKNFRRLLEAFRPEIEDGSTAVVISSDHAEMLGENTYFGHGWNSIEQFWRRELLGIPLSMCLPNYPDKRKVWPEHSESDSSSPSSSPSKILFTDLPYPTSSVDLMPTLFDYFQLDPPVPAHHYSLGKSFFPLSPSASPSEVASQADTPRRPAIDCEAISHEQVVAFDNLNGPIDRVALIRKTTLTSTVYNLNDCLLFSQAYHTRSCRHSQTLVSIFNLSTSVPITEEPTPIPHYDRLECMRQKVFRYLSHPIPQLLYAKTLPTVTDPKQCFEIGRQELKAAPCHPLRASQLWVPSQGGEFVSVHTPMCRLVPPTATAALDSVDTSDASHSMVDEFQLLCA